MSKAIAPTPETEAPIEQSPEPATKNNLSLQERIDVIDWIRTRIEPIFCETWVAAAEVVTKETGVDVSANQIAYIIRELPKLSLGTKLVIGSATNDAARLAAVISELERQSFALAELNKRLAKLERPNAEAEAE